MRRLTLTSLFGGCLWSCATPAESKGCFLAGAEVSMADGTVKLLQDVRVGDAVLSWDDDAQRLAPSIVKANPAFLREPADLVEVALPHATFYATVDHPFWSRGRRGLVSANPNLTAAEYGLTANEFSDGDELEHHQGGALRGVAARLRRPSSVAAVGLRGRRLGAAAEAAAIEVRTLCLEPLHWFYVHGVRVHNKGCFVKTTEVSMASGERKQLQHVRVGDEVLSWDESRQKSAKSTVMVAPTYRRDAAELVEIALPHAKLRATEDHPFWSRGKRGLVSVRPTRTLEAYGLAADVLEVGEALEDERAGDIHVSEVRRLPAPAAAPPLRGRLLGAGNSSANEVDVMTLCLHPHHWFYVHGVRVHNKGCFAPWVRVLLSNGSQVPIAAIQSGDRVASWDSVSGAPIDATVHGVDAFAPRELYLMETPGGVSEAALRQLQGAEGRRGLVFTADHPIFSARRQGVVSMRPNATLTSYGIAAGQMLELELVSDHGGRSIEASVRPWRGEQPSAVMTLRLDGHHWFYAEGVRVHNKGGGGHHFHHGGTHVVRWRGRSDFGSDAAFAGYVIGHSRRRRGVWVSGNDSCAYSANYSSEGSIEPMCARTVGGTMACERCDQCTTPECLLSIEGCSSFLSQLYKGCRSSGAGNVYTAAWSVAVFGGVCCILHQPMARRRAALAKRRQDRQELERACVNGPGLGPTQWQGTYSENGETKPTQYQWTADRVGRIEGTSTDDDGVATVTGAVQWREGEEQGRIAWLETRQGMTLEAGGTIAYLQQPNLGTWGTAPCTPPRPMKIHAAYDSSLGVSGSVELWFGAPPLPEAGQVVPLQNLAPSAAPPQNLGGEGGQPLMG